MVFKLTDMKNVQPKSEYIVEFECYSKLRLTFEAISGLTTEEIVARAAEQANRNFEMEGILLTERIARDHSYAFTALGIDAGSANILNSPAINRRNLKLIK